MKKGILIKSLFLCLILSMALMGCGKKQVTTETTPLATPAPTRTMSEEDELRRQRIADQDRLRQEALLDEQRMAAEMNQAVKQIETNLIYFDYDSFEIMPESRMVLQAKSEILKQFPSLRMIIEGHCDERGTAEYNLALGQRRAQATADFLVLLGVSADRLKTVSYGKERPAVQGSSEAAWAKNRRAEFKVHR
jgi:peptidoglycan-associated lipoprotein